MVEAVRPFPARSENMIFTIVNFLIITIGVSVLIWSIKSNSTLMKGSEHQLLFNLSFGMLAGWFLAVGAIYCINDLFTSFYHLISGLSTHGMLGGHG